MDLDFDSESVFEGMASEAVFAVAVAVAVVVVDVSDFDCIVVDIHPPDAKKKKTRCGFWMDGWSFHPPEQMVHHHLHERVPPWDAEVGSCWQPQ